MKSCRPSVDVVKLQCPTPYTSFVDANTGCATFVQLAGSSTLARSSATSIPSLYVACHDPLHE